MEGKEKKLKVFEIVGEFVDRGEKKKFRKQLKSANAKFAAEKVMCLLGSNHKIKRRNIYLNEVREVGEGNK